MDVNMVSDVEQPAQFVQKQAQSKYPLPKEKLRGNSPPTCEVIMKNQMQGD